ncbi:Type IV secretory pathway%2C VirB4 components [Streptococcus pneumoniae]|uniref:type IV secretory system conjugative DNA transfer family protein n=1 Tax=Bacilli TaxID=91061 RepID=UPI0005DDE1A8|nr:MULTISPECIES: type IV secretory system conjugative DNA transfer family protein [Bacilli]MDA2738828.1 type IV secretory system conjugative DNA transfer family protein [Bacillus cereus group sp. Bc015]CKE76120.1 Type IV secretory pathway%2C VirB4 components [Streptococcus pneumoniae]CKE78691.1 Type IV secretory pathway%2C VirB4 components [Streptococcus pneumoniae]CKE88270.1 Type IV secretory pathway%2C VirB4 components [Streptococcus pneumoniae]CKF08172.1 Type IV secretory pathway%2C VirB4 c
MERIPTDQHVFITGQTGTGKSFLAEMYLRGYEYVVKLDTKGEVFERRKKKQPVWEGLKEGRDYTVIEHLADIDDVETKKIIYAPDFQEQEQEYYDALMKWVYRRENTILWIDELMEVCPSPFKYPPYLKGLMTRGRSKEAVVWACTQRPSDIPSIVMGNSDHFFVFDQNLPQDRKKLCETTGSYKFMDLPGYRNFWYFKRGWSDPVLATLKP